MAPAAPGGQPSSAERDVEGRRREAHEERETGAHLRLLAMGVDRRAGSLLVRNGAAGTWNLEKKEHLIRLAYEALPEDA
jgi:hypothetical protein